MSIVVESFNGNDLQSANLEAWLTVGDNPFGREVDAIFVEPVGRFARYARSQHKRKVLPVNVRIVSGTLNTWQRTLEQWFEPGTQGALVITEDGVSKAWDAVVKSRMRYAQGAAVFQAVLEIADPRLRSETVATDTEAITSSGEQWTVNNPGTTAEVSPVIRVTPTDAKAAADSWIYTSEVIIANQVDRALNNYAVAIPFAHATEVTATRSQADGDDVRVLVDGKMVPRWAGGAGWDDDGLLLWINLPSSPGLTARLREAITDVSPADGGDLPVEEGDTSGWPSAGVLRIAGEAIRYSGITSRAFTGVTRGARNTTAAAASAAAEAQWVEHRVQLLWGYSAATAPDARDDLEPMIDLVNSTNEEHIWENFADTEDPGRSMQWARNLVTRDAQTGRVLAPSGAPAASMSFEYRVAGPKAGSPNFNTWQRQFPTGTLNVPDGITFVDAWTQGTTGSVTSVTVTIVPGDLADGDFLVAAVQAGATGAVAATGWTEHADSPENNFHIFTMTVEDASTLSATHEFSCGAGRAAAVIAAYRGPNGVDIAGSATASGSVPDAPSVTTTVPDTLLLTMYGSEVDLASTCSWTASDGQTARAQVNSDDAGAGPNDASVFVADIALAEAGVSGAYTADDGISGITGNVNSFSLALSAGVGEVDVDVDADMALEVYGTDVDGNEVLMSTVVGEHSGVQSIVAPEGGLFAVAFSARSQVVMRPVEGALTADVDPTTAYGTVEQQFTAPAGVRDAELRSIRVPLQSTSGTPTATMSIYSDDGAGAPLERVSAEVTATVSGSTYADYEFEFNLPLVEGALYWWRLKGSSNAIRARRTTGPYAGGVSPTAGYVYRFTGLATDLEFEDGAEAAAESMVMLDSATVRLDPTGIPYVAVQSRQAAYWLDAVLENTTTGQTITFAVLMAVDDEIEIDIGRGTARNTTADEAVFDGLVFSDPYRFDLDPGDNTLEWTEAGLVGVSVEVDVYGRWA